MEEESFFKFTDEADGKILSELSALKDALLSATGLFEGTDFTNVQILRGEQGKQGIQGTAGKDGYSPVKGVDYFDGKDGLSPDLSEIVKEALLQIPIPKDGINGSPDTGAEIVNKINDLEIKDEFQIDAKHIKNLPRFDYTKLPQAGITTTFFALNGANVGRAKNINFTTGTTLNVTLLGDTATITIPLSAPGGGITSINGDATVAQTLSSADGSIFITDNGLGDHDFSAIHAHYLLDSTGAIQHFVAGADFWDISMGLYTLRVADNDFITYITPTGNLALGMAQTSNHQQQFQDSSGTIALLSDIPSAFIASVSDTNTIDLDATGQNLTANVLYQDSSSVDLSDDVNGLKADVLISATAGNIITINPDGLYATATGGIYTVDNGLTENPASNFQLGGALIQNTFIDTGTAFGLAIGTGVQVLGGVNTFIGGGRNQQALGHNSAVIGGANGVATGVGGVNCGTDGDSFGDYSFVANDAIFARGIASAGFGFGHWIQDENGFSIGTDHVIGALVYGGGTADLYKQSWAWGNTCATVGSRSHAGGHWARATAQDSVMIGTGVNSGNPIVNSETLSFAVGYNSNVPTFRVHTASGVGTFGLTEAYGTLAVGSISQDDTETKVVVWNSTDKVLEWRAVSTIGLSSTLTNTHIFVGNISNVATDVAMSGDATIANTGALTLATVNADVGTFGSATQVGVFTVNAKGLITAASNTSIAITSSAVTDFNEAAQDAVGNILTDTDSVDFTYDDAGNTISAIVKFLWAERLIGIGI